MCPSWLQPGARLGKTPPAEQRAERCYGLPVEGLRCSFVAQDTKPSCGLCWFLSGFHTLLNMYPPPGALSLSSGGVVLQTPS